MSFDRLAAAMICATAFLILSCEGQSGPSALTTGGKGGGGRGGAAGERRAHGARALVRWARQDTPWPGPAEAGAARRVRTARRAAAPGTPARRPEAPGRAAARRPGLPQPAAPRRPGLPVAPRRAG